MRALPWLNPRKIIAMSFLLPMIPTRMPNGRYTPSQDPVIGQEYVEFKVIGPTRPKECAICRRSNADYEHTCGVAFHKDCIQQYFDAISGFDGVERVCPHCYSPVPMDLELEGTGVVEVSPLSEDVYNQYLELNDEFSMALIDDRVKEASVFLNSPSGEQYFLNVDFGYYPKKPTFSFPDELLTNLDGLEELLEELSNWDLEFPPRLVDVLLGIESRIRPKEKKEVKEGESEGDGSEGGGGEGGESEGEESEGGEFEGERSQAEEKADETKFGQEQKDGFVEVFPEDEIVEVSPENLEGGENSFKVEEILPATFFELETFEPVAEEVEQSDESFENEEAIQQYLDLSNSYSVELIDDNIYHVVVYVSCLDAGVYNIYPITMKFRDYPKKPTMVFTDDLLIRIRGLDGILDKLQHWDALSPQSIVDILQGLETKLIEDSMVESEIEVIKREYNSRRPRKNRLVVTLYTYGPKFFDVELNIKDYPSPPLISLPEDLKDLDMDELEGIKKWPEKPQKRIMDVLRSLSQAINNLYRMNFEESLLRMVTDEFKVVDGEYHVALDIPWTEKLVMDEENPINARIRLKIRIPQAYPLVHPEIEINVDSEELRRVAGDLLVDALKSWTPSMFLADALNRVSLSLSDISLFKCLICGREECPVCGHPLLMAFAEETSDICEIPCIQCKRPYHVHCLTQSASDGIPECGYCLKDLSRFKRSS